MFDSYVAPGLALIAQFQQLSPALDLPMKAVTFLGALEFYLILLPFIYWTLDPGLATRTLGVVLFNDFFSSTFKILWHGPRPYWIPDGGVRGMAVEPDYGVPSGHAGGSLVTWGYLATQLRSTPFRLLAVALILLIGFSRPYLGVHFPHDVVMGWLIGAAVLLLVLGLQAQIGQWLAGLSARRHLLVAAGSATVVMVWGLVVPQLVAGSPDPAAWASFAVSSRSPSHFFALAGSLFGLMMGYRRLRTGPGYRPADGWPQRLRCFVVGIAVMAALYLGLGALSHALTMPETLASFLLRFIRFALVTWWIAELAPRLFVRLNWASVDESQSPGDGARPGASADA